MAGDKQPGSISALGDADPTMFLEVGQNVTIVGPPSLNAHNVSYTPINIAEKGDDLYWVRSSSVVEDAAAPAAPAKTVTTPSGKRVVIAPIAAPETPWWIYAAAGVGVLGVGYLGWRLVRR